MPLLLTTLHITLQSIKDHLTATYHWRWAGVWREAFPEVLANQKSYILGQ